MDLVVHSHLEVARKIFVHNSYDQLDTIEKGSASNF
jgi:hypothetical protein